MHTYIHIHVCTCIYTYLPVCTFSFSFSGIVYFVSVVGVGSVAYTKIDMSKKITKLISYIPCYVVSFALVGIVLPCLDAYNTYMYNNNNL